MQLNRILIALLLILSSCSSSSLYKKISKAQQESNISKNFTTQAIVEIPAGTLDKYELNKQTKRIEHEIKNGAPRVVNYLAYPANYGFIPDTILSKEKGGDGDPLDVLILGSSAKRGEIMQIKIIGVLRLLDQGDQDDKLIAVSKSSPFSTINNIRELNSNFPGASKIIETWFSNYKGKNKIKSLGYEGPLAAFKILKFSKEAL